uniref:Uncharacterized protein n=1 Tax=uncultured bacterium pBE3-1 TaxID=1781161 RepID=A0A1C9U540_9BACT|nr:hypothetical protein [uncultured bacterium pBE3-1]
MQYGHELVRQIEFLRDSQSLSKAHLRNIRRYVGVIVLTMMSVSGVESVWAVPKETSAEKAEHLRQQANPQLFNDWTFDKDQIGAIPAGFLAAASGDQPGGEWKVEAQPAAPSSPNVLLGVSACSACVELLVAQGFQYEYPDLVVRIRQGTEAASGQVGVVFGMKDPKNYYATVVDLSQKTIEMVRVIDGVESVIGRAELKAKPVEWHTLRVRRNTIISKDFIEAFFDGKLTLSTRDQALGVGEVGLLVRGEASAHFDNFNASPQYSSRPLSAPAAY